MKGQGEKKLAWLAAGGMNLDILAKPYEALIRNDSNPGTIRERPGGVGFNMARNLALLGQEVIFLTALGGDRVNETLVHQAEEHGLDLSRALVKEQASTSRYLAVHDQDGDMAVAINDMALFDGLTGEDVLSWLDLGRPDRAMAAILDTNLPAPVLETLAGNWEIPLYADAVSTVKMDRLAGIIPRLEGLKVNRMEAEHLTGKVIADDRQAAAAAGKILDMGVTSVCISMGSQGALFARGQDMVLARPERIIRDANATGAGDTMAAAFALAAHTWDDLARVARFCVAAASLNLESPEAVNPMLSLALVSQRADRIRIEEIK